MAEKLLLPLVVVGHLDLKAVDKNCFHRILLAVGMEVVGHYY